MSSLISNYRVIGHGSIEENESSFIVNGVEIFPKSIIEGALLIPEDPPSASSTGWMYVDGSFVEIVVQPEEVDPDEYKAKRAKEYPPTTDYLDGVVKGDQAQVQAYIDACLAVKAKYPKP
jgi:hypothetical protein